MQSNRRSAPSFFAKTHMAGDRMADWDDLRFALAVAETGSLAAAARHLGVNHTTVLRRVNGLEARLGVRLFERLATGYALTAAGTEAVEVAGTLGATIDTLERRLAGRDLSLAGSLRVTTVDSLGIDVLMPHLAAFRRMHPDIVLELTFQSAMANLTRRDADVAVRPAETVPETLVGRRVCEAAFAVYGAAGAGTLDRGPWIALDETLATTMMGRWLRTLPATAVVACRVDSVIAAREAARLGMGLVLLPCYIGDITPGLARMTDPLPELRAAIWLLTHPDLRRTARVRAFLDFLGQRLGAQRDAFEGRLPAPRRNA